MHRLIVLFASICAMLMGLTTPASAASDFSFRINIPGRDDGSFLTEGILTCAAGLDANNSCIVTAITGNVSDPLYNNGALTPITSLSFYNDADNRIIYRPNDPNFEFKGDLTRGGLSFTTSSLENLFGPTYNAFRFGTNAFGQPLFSTVDNLSGPPNKAGARSGFKLDLISAVGAVPEPSTWLMMILGFGIVGGTLRSRRRFRHDSLPLPALA